MWILKFDGVCYNCETVLFLLEVNKYDWGRSKHFRAPRAFLFTRSSKFIYKILFASGLREHFLLLCPTIHKNQILAYTLPFSPVHFRI